MELTSLISHWLASTPALLPDPAVQRWVWHGLWALVLASGVLRLARPLPRLYRLGLGVLVLGWTWLAGVQSPAHWLGLAFQAPSLMSVALCLGCCWTVVRPGARVPLASDAVSRLAWLGVTGVVLGWVLLLDTLAWWPVSLYAWGFSSAAMATVALCAALFWALASANQAGRSAAGLVAGVLLLFVLTRWPTGNVWDALLDPWLWGVLQLRLIVSAARCWRAPWRRPAPTRA